MFRIKSTSAAKLDLPAALRKWKEARNLSVSGPRRALARGAAAVYDDPPEPSPGQCCSATRVCVPVLTSERITLQMRASMGAKRQFMSVPPRRCG